MLNPAMFYFLTVVILVFSAGVVLFKNPIYSALSLATTMVGLAFMYYLLDAHFIAGVQLIVYAGAVMVLFVMVLMLFDLKKEKESYSGRAGSIFFKMICGMALMGIFAAVLKKTYFGEKEVISEVGPQQQMLAIKQLSVRLFTEYVFAFEALGVLLLLIAVGVVAVARAKGGTHAR